MQNRKALVERSAKIIWDYMLLNQKLVKSDFIFVLGSNDTRVAKYAAELFLKGCAELLIFSGGLGRITKETFTQTESETFAKIAIKMGVPREKIIIENKSTNTGENILFTRKLLEDKKIDYKSFILVQKPYMERRTFATFKKQWPGVKFVVTSPIISFEKYPNVKISQSKMINTMVGDLQRIKLYPSKGFQIKQSIPKEVWVAYEKLVELGYNKQLIK